MFRIYIPVKYRKDYLRRCLDSLAPHSDKIVLIEKPGLSFSKTMNWIQQDAISKRLDLFFWMHSDAECERDVVSEVLATNDWDICFTNVDALSATKIEVAKTVHWDEGFAWYYSDTDFYRRVKLAGYRIKNDVPIIDGDAEMWRTALRMGVYHHCGQTVKSMNLRSILRHAETNKADRQRYLDKWKGLPGFERVGRSFTTDWGQPGLVGNISHGTKPVVFHAPGYMRKTDFWTGFSKWVVNSSPRLDEAKKYDYVVVVVTNSKEETLVEKSLRSLGIPCTVMGREIETTRAGRLDGLSAVDHEWMSFMKRRTEVFAEWLKGCRAKYVIFLDAFDVVLTGHPNRIVEAMLRYDGCRMLFNATMGHWPEVTECPETKAAKDFENRLGCMYHSLNAGAWVGEVEYVKALFAKLLDNRSKISGTFKHEDQTGFRLLLPSEYPRMGIDSGCHAFQVVGSGEDVGVLHLGK